MTPYRIPGDAEFLDEALHFIDVCRRDCSCPDHWHFLWAGLKAAGLRRGVYRQHDAFRRALDGRLRDGTTVLIAGAADAGSLYVLHAACGAVRARFTVVDRCQAPLTMVREHAVAIGLDVRTHRADIARPLPADGPWDVILIHNTLILMDGPARRAALREAAHALAADGIVLCNVRYNAPTSPHDERAVDEETRVLTERLRRTFAAHPAAFDVLAPLVASYVRAEEASLARRPSRDELTAEIADEGFEVVGTMPETTVMPSIVSQRNAALNIQAELLLLRRRGAP